MSATAQALLGELAALGVGAEARDGALVLRPAASVDTEIQAEGRAPGEAHPAPAALPEDADPQDPPAGWTYCREGRLAGCWVGPGGELAAGAAEAVEAELLRRMGGRTDR